jgi:dolichol-phosphate mannosyltransferase
LTNELTVVVPTCNECGNIKPLVNALASSLKDIKWEVIFVDDDSSDGTPELVRRLAQEDHRIRCIQRINRRGLSSACIEGMLASASPYVAVIDADLQHDERIIPVMLSVLKEEHVDLVIGSRYMEGGSTGDLSPFRVWISRFATRWSRLVINSPVTDPMSGFFMLNRPVFESVMRNLSGKGFKILMDILISARGGLKLKELPYTMRERSEGESKLTALVIWEFFTLIAHKLLGRIFPIRFISFVIVGFSGVFVHLLVLGILYRLLTADFVISQSAATLVAMTSNFILNNIFTYQDKKLLGIQFFRGLFSFYLACSFGAIINVALATMIFNISFPWWLAGTLGAVAGAVWNYSITSIFTWGKREVSKSGE